MRAPLSSRLIAAAAALAGLAAAPAAVAAPRPLHIEGNRIVDDANQTVVLRGVNVPSLEWDAHGEPNPYSQPAPKSPTPGIKESIRIALEDWHATLIRLPLNPTFWLADSPEAQSAYKLLVQDIVATVAAHDAYIILDMHVSCGGDRGVGCSQHSLADAHTQAALADLAANPALKNQASVLIGLYNEPCRVSWDQWRHGGQIDEPQEGSRPAAHYQAVGMQDLVQAVRAQGAQNVLVAGTREWCSTLQGLCDGGVLLDDKNVIYDAHVYPGVGPSPADWDAKVGCAAAQVPLLVGEFGCGSDANPFPGGNATWQPDAYMQAILPWIDGHGFSATAWTLAPLAPPCLVKDWEGTPSCPFGAAVKAWLVSHRP